VGEQTSEWAGKHRSVHESKNGRGCRQGGLGNGDNFRSGEVFAVAGEFQLTAAERKQKTEEKTAQILTFVFEPPPAPLSAYHTTKLPSPTPPSRLKPDIRFPIFLRRFAPHPSTPPAPHLRAFAPRRRVRDAPG
jgi:hypothetical protein